MPDHKLVTFDEQVIIGSAWQQAVFLILYNQNFAEAFNMKIDLRSNFNMHNI